ncbi:hypothetical protein ATZ33_07015 [Enterococcus silesiacus]|uniref:Nucleotide kinase n=1 Tax=Enterococcus silesiacus TaxID=332949 RepID=A0A0S3K9X0_9ENTE|nr:nucleoside-triphosphatase [Enterococcus silesiacus]ALS01126.1 hypothetical protein ATZ33_07015 [Enterococcus silesiacus]OJG92517.1 hypothetical protein RV15_GL002942 [Enterococcus silesiacus]
MTKFFLEGDKLIGKSTLLKEVILAGNFSVSGFYVKRQINDQGEIVGFELREAKELLEDQPDLQEVPEHCFIQTENGKRTRNLKVFETFGLELLKEAQLSAAEIILLDEIGGVELLAKSFREALLAVMRQPKKIIGVFKSEANYQRQKQQMREKLEIDWQRVALKQEICKDKGQIVTLNGNNFQVVQKQLSGFLNN